MIDQSYEDYYISDKLVNTLFLPDLGRKPPCIVPILPLCSSQKTVQKMIKPIESYDSDETAAIFETEIYDNGDSNNKLPYLTFQGESNKFIYTSILKDYTDYSPNQLGVSSTTFTNFRSAVRG